MNTCKHDMKSTWATIKEIIGTRKENKDLPSSFNIDNEIITDKQQIAESMNNYFSTIGSKLSGESTPTRDYANYLTNINNQNSIFISPTSQEEILKITRELKPKTSKDTNEISTKLMKQTINTIISPITHIMNLSLSKGTVPDMMKISKTIPIYKSGDEHSLNNYRPISLLPTFSKILEKLMYKRLVNFLEKNKLLYKHQYGFRKKHSTIHPIIQFLSNTFEALENKPPKPCMGIFIDLSKAFDTINHNILLNKLKKYGIRGTAYNWIKSYLTDRKQYIEIEENKSTLKDVNCGVPQGSILGPLLFLIYINDIKYSTINSQVLLSYADDTTIFITGPNIDSMFHNANTVLGDLHKWLKANKLIINAQKTKYMIFGPKHYNTENHYLSINNQEIERVTNGKSIKFLGIHLDENLTWKNHTKSINSKIAIASFSLNRVKNILPKNILIQLYYTLVHPHLIYNILAWGNANKNALNKTIVLQKRSIRIINKSKYNSHTEPLFKQNKILKLKDLYAQQVMKFMLQYEKNELPESFLNMYKRRKEIHPQINTRQDNTFHIKQTKLTLSKKLPPITFPETYNNWINKLKPGNMSTKIKLKLMTNLILDKYSSQVSCVNPYCNQCNPNHNPTN